MVWTVASPKLPAQRASSRYGTLNTSKSIGGSRLSQPAVSARVRGLERLVGFAVLTRSARGSNLTPNGALLAEWARGVLAAADVLEAGIASLRSDRIARLRVAASLTVAEHLLPSWLVVLAATHPDTAVSLTAGNSDTTAAAVLAGDADLGFIEGPDLPPACLLRSWRPTGSWSSSRPLTRGPTAVDR